MSNLIVAMLLLMFCAIGFAGGYMIGHHRGWTKARSKAFRQSMTATMAALNGRQYLKEYDRNDD